MPTLVCIASRDGHVRHDVLGAAVHAVTAARAAGVEADLSRCVDPYSVATCRNRGVADFLARAGFTHLLFVDDDVILPADAVTRLAGSAARTGAAVMLGCYPTYKVPRDGEPYTYVAVMPLGRGGDDWHRGWFEGVAEVEGGGAGCMMVRRDAFAAVGFPWFRWPERWDEATGTISVVSDDMDFCARVRAAGLPIFADGAVRCGHRKAVDLRVLMGTT